MSVDIKLDDSSPHRYGELPIATGGLPVVGGIIKDSPEDFVVEEIPAYQPSGSGEHLFLWIEKRLLSAEELKQTISSTLGVNGLDIGMAGLKDRMAVTRQFISIPRRYESSLGKLDGTSGLKILTCKAHEHKLRTGHNRGNRFNIIVRCMDHASFEHLPALISRLKVAGFPNFFGKQRFAADARNARQGLAMIREATRSRGGRTSKNRFTFSCAQAWLYNHYLGKRWQAQNGEELLAGDLVHKKPGGIFIVDDLDLEQARYLRGELEPTGPIYGAKILKPKAAALHLEEEILRANDLSWDSFTPFSKLMPGTRRINRIIPTDLTYTLIEHAVSISFSLPSGCYATVLLANIISNDTKFHQQQSRVD